MGKRKNLLRYVGMLIGMITLVIVVFLYVGRAPKVNPAFGMTVSTQYAKFLGEDVIALTTMMVDELKPAVVRVPVYWNDVEIEKGIFNFKEIDEVVDVLAAHNTSIIIATGYKVPRWPECHPPTWASALSDDEFDRAVVDFVKATIEHYKKFDHVIMWQIENEPTLQFYGPCSRFTLERFEQELSAVRALDSRPILVTDSGELSSWWSVARFGDVLGVTMYRRTHNPMFGYVTYPLRPIFYYRKALLVRLLNDDKPVFGVELQMEPWAQSGDVRTMSDEDVAKSWSIETMEKNIEYAQQSGFPLHLLWGVEYWYHLKSQGDAAAWDAAREIMN